MSHTEFAKQSTLDLILPEGPGRLEFLYEEGTMENDRTMSHIPPGSSWGPPPHWHQTHTEGFRIKQGFVRLTYGHTTRICGPNDGDLSVGVYVPHSFSRADCSPVPVDQAELAKRDEEDKGWREREVILEEWATPSDGSKEVFFRNIFSFYVDEIQPFVVNGVKASQIPTLIGKIVQPLASLDGMDMYIYAGGSWGMKADGTVNLFARTVSYGILTFAKVLNIFIGGRYWFKEYTPPRLRPYCEKTFGKA